MNINDISEEYATVHNNNSDDEPFIHRNVLVVKNLFASLPEQANSEAHSANASATSAASDKKRNVCIFIRLVDIFFCLLCRMA